MFTSAPRVAAAATAFAIFLSTPVLAQGSSNVIGTEGDWTVFSASNPKECWAVSAPKSTQNLDSSGKPKEVTRGDIRLYVAYRPGQAGEVSFSGGYPFAPDSAVEVNIGGQVFKLFTEGESAWTGSPAEDSKLVSALRAGSSAVVTGRSARGTVTKDTFSLSGITAATNKAQAACK
ncbi:MULTISPECIES: invasion associated locus B family protein [unclassified Paracoccus (in: a-proteobacteria)]|uniref:invasion associated locus B family protein n=1 Tax=unclassified Paracoccus (in: a-proteobacteria) TaxID=2688777 RepID=UPI0012B1D4D1|nr:MULTISPECIES: invasion associated locus B family protein [unclassified Paracoccus (in: a-proteobacteria)]UXU76004.1 invasion associated locus B family protein [Paracoccus sp. SMMA_5]UXU81914.1 invasion associated locus B family protein [Paracoccus sp. SMMA_5_TC]